MSDKSIFIVNVELYSLRSKRKRLQKLWSAITMDANVKVIH